MARLPFYTTVKLGPRRSMTPEGFLVCHDVAVARTGMQIYGPDETPIEAGDDDLVKIFREPEEVFRPETIASAQGKPVTNDHPDEDVRPDNWKELAIGTMMNVRRGEGALDDLLLADLMITDKEGIEAIESGKREVSCGYDADYEEAAPGTGYQRNIVINHVALVEQGRCGVRCAVGDSKPTKEITMAKKGSKIADAIAEGLQKAIAIGAGKQGKARDEDLPEAAEKGDVHVHVHTGSSFEKEDPVVTDEGELGGAGGDPAAEAEKAGRVRFTDDQLQEHMDQNAAEHAEMRSRIEQLEAMVAKLTAGEAGEQAADEGSAELESQLKEEAPAAATDEDIEQIVKAKDSRWLGESFKDTVAQAEILAPGIRIPTYDHAAKPAQTFKKICTLRRQALDVAYAQASTRGIIDEILGGKTFDTANMTCDAVRVLFKSAAVAKAKANRSAGATTDADVSYPAQTGVISLASLNQRHKAHWKR